MACGTPTITSFGVDIWQDIQQGGAVIEENTPLKIADCIEKLCLLDKEEIKSLGKQSRDWVFSELNPEKIARKYISMYSDAIKKHNNN